MSEPGFIYILSNPCFRYLKIGHTKNNPYDRAKQLSRLQAAPMPFSLEYAAYIEGGSREAEKIIHANFEEQRIGKEFFDIGLQAAIGAIDSELGNPPSYKEWLFEGMMEFRKAFNSIRDRV